MTTTDNGDDEHDGSMICCHVMQYSASLCDTSSYKIGLHGVGLEPSHTEPRDSRV